MRSNDVFLGLPHDIFSFTMMQEIAACELNVKMGSYHHSVASLHLYDDTDEPNGVKPRTLAQLYLDEGLHDKVPMPPMPAGDPWPAIRELVRAERDIREGKDYIAPKCLDPYWCDLITLLHAHAIAVKSGSPEALETLLATLNFEGYRLYILDRIAKRKQPSAVRDFFKGNADDASRST
jgi:thymidylate synthase